MNIYISNLDLTLTNEDLRKLFEPFGSVEQAEIAMDAFTDKSRGYGNVEMPNDTEAQKAIDALNNTSVSGKTISVEVAKPKEVHKGSYKVGNGIFKEYRFYQNKK